MITGLLKIVCSGIPVLLLGISFQQDRFAVAREQMVDQQIEARGISHRGVLAAMRKVERHHFVPEAYRQLAYADQPLPIGYGQTISQPYIVAYMTELIQPRPSYKVLEIGTGSGYQAAVLAEITAQVYTIEIVEELARQAEELLLALGYKNIFVKAGDGYAGWNEHAPFDAIVVTAAADSIPKPLIEQLKEGGIMVIPVGGEHQIQTLKVVEKKNSNVIIRNVAPVRFVPFIHKE
ncbi:MAG: protein-L-isoaspartate(D-aspartate) O-methyltransferase [Mangrovibacterium sp.]